MKFNDTDLLDLASGLKAAIEMHEVKSEYQDSLLSDILFQVASLIDEKQGSTLHEEVFGLLENYTPQFSDYLVCELDIKYGDEVLETNVLKSNIEISEGLLLNLELLLDLRDISEIDDDIDTNSKFQGSKLSELTFKPLHGANESYRERFSTLQNLVNFIAEVAGKWV
ncbi:hypothetical protein VST7929_02961 [Vibrio stylophorae]|uniref:Uncharacterized protein n=1 Tax=Vibrio stylophorae TaxID=659351 RepID=A0ABM8ZXL4_9VIBR|nr:hypothetical protein [Vibrio stylophorae]CAH0535388.1 hypothetical protein VST7929_02961 [Vibrio stylophorae]